ncbi:MAG: response regulator [Elusimicrobia bacterium]|nr:response regulator [Elusimicrobiota bacterium]
MAEPANMSSKGSASRILIVDDEESLIYVWQRFFGKEGMLVDFAGDGKQALDLIKRGDYAVIFSDLNLPSLRGEELARLARERDPLVCVNVITGAPSIEGAVACMKMGACDYMGKPFDPLNLVVKARRCLQHYAQKKEMAAMKEELARYEEINRLKSEFVSNVSHELRTPLFSTRGAFDLLRVDLASGLDQTRRKLLGVIENNLDRLGQVIGNVLDFAKLERGTLKPEFKSVSLHDLAQEVMESLSPLFTQRGVVAAPLKREASGRRIEADSGQIRQVLTNLVGNAVKFTPSGGRVGIEIRDHEAMLEMIIWDTGIGVAPQEHSKIFDRFYQVDGSLAREAGGSGIGLAIVKGIVDLHGGAVWIESKLGEGSRFHVSLPKVQTKEQGNA